MEKILNFLNKYGTLIILCVVVILFFRSCNLNKKVKKLNHQVVEQQTLLIEKLDSISKYQITDVDLQIEGLKAEKRMIQSTDRKRFDLERENQIDKEIKILEKERK